MKLGSLLKRDAILFKRGVLSALVLALLFLLLCVGAADAFSSAEGGDGVLTVLLVDDDNSLLSRLAISAVKEQKYMEAALKVEKTELDDAMERLRSGDCAAVIILPQGYIDAIASGRRCQGKIMLSPAASLHSDVVEKLARAGERLIAAGQNGVFCGESLIWSHGAESSVYSDYLTKSNVALMETATGAFEKYFTVEMLDYADTDMSLAAHYALCWITLALGFCTMFFRELYFTDLELLPRLVSTGVREWQFVLGKVLYPAILRVALVFAAAGFLGEKAGVNLALSGIVLVVFAVLMSSLIGAAAIIRFNSRGSVILLLADSAALFLSGGVIPRTMLPETMTRVANFLPFGAVKALLSPLFGGKCGIINVITALLYLIAAAYLTHSGLSRCLKGDVAE